MPPNQEIEFKLAIHPSDVATFRHLSLLREKCIGKPQRRKVHSIYFDTPSLELQQGAMALRLRKTGGRWLQTLKTAGNMTGGLHQRGEWEHPLRLPQLDLALFRDTPLAELASRDQLHLILEPAFVTNFQRTTWQIDVAPGQRVEVVLDQGVIRAGQNELPISEIEIELLEGDRSAVYDIAAALVGQVSVRMEMASKAERGYRLYQAEQAEPAAPLRARSVELRRKWLPVHAMQEVVAACLGHFERNIEGALVGDDPEYLHQLRVALRRLRSALRVFRPADTEDIVAELKWLTGALGDARDWDVFTTETLPILLDGFGDAALGAELLAAAEQKRAAAGANARTALASPRQMLLLISIGRWLSVAAQHVLLPRIATAEAIESTTETPLPSLKDFAALEIRRRHKRLLRDAVAVAELPVAARHKVRIDAKRLRYSVEFFAELFDRKRVAPYAKLLTAIQDLLGHTNDHDVAMKRVEILAPTARFVDFSRGWFAARTQLKLEAIDQHVAKLKKARRFWGKTIAAEPAEESGVDEIQ